MARVTIDYGIDLGTTNSEIAMLKGTEIEVFKDNDGFDHTPSVVWIDKQNRTRVGQPAKTRLEDDPDNAVCEFKLQMGKDEEAAHKVFLRSGRRMKPEELSAEVLKELRRTVKLRTGEDVEAAVITVPAAFDLPECNATKTAAELAGISQVMLLQEPCAAGLAYGFQSDSNKVFWFVYDFGGGTFDAAIIQVRDGLIQVVNHGGDKHLGGKLIDWAIVDEILVPAVTRENRFPDFRRDNPKWLAAIGKLKQESEKAKIRLSGSETTEIIIENLCPNGRGGFVHFEYELKRSDVEKLAEPFFLRTVNICKKVLSEKRLDAKNMERIILVGGPTNMPYLRDRLADNIHGGLGIPLEFRVDPLTVVARGAAIFAGTQRIKAPSAHRLRENQLSLELDYKPISPETEPLVGGKVLGAHGKDFSGYTIEFVNNGARPAWRSGRIRLGADGGFVTNVWAEKKRSNTIDIEVCDPTGLLIETVPSSFTYTVGNVITDQPLCHSVGVALANNGVAWYFEKGTPLPVRRREIFKTAFNVLPGQPDDVIRIIVVEGSNPRADRNHPIATVEIEAHKLKRRVPPGSDVEVTMEIDESRLLRLKAYIPILDEEYEDALSWETEKTSPASLRKGFDHEKARLDKLREKANETRDQATLDFIDRIDQEQMLHEVETSLAAASVDFDASQKANHRLIDLKIALDQAEDAVEWPVLTAEAQRLMSVSHEIIRDHGENADKKMLEKYHAEIRDAIQIHDVDILQKKVDELRGFLFRVLDRKGIMQWGWFEDLCKMRAQMRDRAMAEQLIVQGQRAMNNNDIDGLRAVNRQLSALLPEPPPPPDISTILKG